MNEVVNRPRSLIGANPQAGSEVPKRSGTIEAGVSDLHGEANELEEVVTRLETALANSMAPGKDEAAGSAPLSGNCSIAQGISSVANNLARSRTRMLAILDRLQIA
jgi:hypothetical protein